jgi:glycosyltransferase involved in cell wall biosynthesis
MRVGIDARFVTRYPRRGIGTYSLNLISELVKVDKTIDYVLYIDRPDVEGILPEADNVRVRRLRMPLYPLWEQVALPLAASRDRLDVLHCLGNTAPLVLPTHVRRVLSLMDVMFLQSGEFIPKPTTAYQRAGRLYRSLVSPRNARASDAVITISEFSRGDIIRLIPNLVADRVAVTHLDCDSIFSNQPGALLPATETHSPFILCLGAEDPRKNTQRAVRAYLSAVKQYGIRENLIVSGYANWERSAAFREVQLAGASERVKFLGFVSIDALAQLYREATLFLYPSLYEGFGIPMLEAFASGCPVVASKVTSMPEVGGEAALYVNPTDESDIEQAIVRLVTDASLRRGLVDRGHVRRKEFGWSLTARRTLDIYRQVTSDQGPAK